MQARKPVGRQAAARKYDLLTALGAFALAHDKTVQRQVLRLITLITARYNWAQDELAIGQREIARLWACDERTVKREMARLRARSWLTVRRQGARGRVTEYRLQIDRILADTQPHWAAVGPDFDLRLQGSEESNVVPLPVKGAVEPPDSADTTEWGLARAVFHAEDPALFAAWVRGLRRVGRSGGALVLAAPSRFHASYVNTHLRQRLLAVCESIDPAVRDIRIVL